MYRISLYSSERTVAVSQSIVDSQIYNKSGEKTRD